MKLDLACGNARTSGFVGVDKYLPPDPNRLQFDLLEFPWRFPDESIEEVVCHHFIEHIPMTETPDGVDLLCAFMDEVWRILKTGGQATFSWPHVQSTRAFQDPTHRRFIPWETFAYFDLKYRKHFGLEHYPIKANFDIVSCEVVALRDDVNTLDDQTKAKAIDRMWNTANDMMVVIEKRPIVV